MATQVVKKSEVNKVDNQVVKISEVNNQVTKTLISISKNVEEWSKLVEEVTNHMQQLYGTPGKATSNLVEKYFDQMESTLKATIQQQQEISDENQALLKNFIDRFIDQVKKTNKGSM